MRWINNASITFINSVVIRTFEIGSIIKDDSLEKFDTKDEIVRLGPQAINGLKRQEREI